MIRLKKHTKRSLRRDRNDDLSIVTGGRAPIHLGGNSTFKRLKRERMENEKLRQHFESARAKAYFAVGERPPGLRALSTRNANDSSSDPNFTSSSHYKNDLNGSLNFPVPSSQQPPPQSLGGLGPDENGHWSIKCLPPLISLADTRKAVQASQQKRRQLVGSSANSSQVLSFGSQNHYWTTYGNATRRVQKQINITPMLSSKSKRNAGRSSTWKIIPSMTMTRETASMVQMEVAAAMSNSSSGRSNSMSLPSILQSPLDHLGLMSTQSSNVIPTLIKGVRPPPSPMFPVAVTPNSSFSSGGVYQSEWIDRSKCQDKAFTKQFSIEQLMDIMCGFATPDSIMASNLFDPFPTTGPLTSESSESTIFPCLDNQRTLVTPTTATSLTDDFQSSRGDANHDDDDDDGETSIYFKSPSSTAKKKSVSFLTDTQDNICVTRHFFDPFSQDYSGSFACLFPDYYQQQPLIPIFPDAPLPPSSIFP